MNVQTLVTHMLIGMGTGNHNGKPLKTMKDLYLCFEPDIVEVARQTHTNTGIVFAELIDAVEESRAVLRDAVESARAKLEAEDAKREAEAKAAAVKATEAPRRTRRAAATTTAPVGRKKPGVSRKTVTVTVEPKRRGRPPKSR